VDVSLEQCNKGKCDSDVLSGFAYYYAKRPCTHMTVRAA